MATLVLDRSGLELRSDGSSLALYESGEKRSTIALNLIDRLVIQGNVGLSSAVLTRLSEAGVATVLLSRRHSRRVAVIFGRWHSDAAVRLAQYQLSLDEAWCRDWARRVVAAKIRAELRLARMARGRRPDCRKTLSDSIASLRETLRTLQSSPSADVARIRGIEGAAAAAHFRALTSLFPESLGFTRRTRRPPRDPVNACLSLGYTMLHFEAVHACFASGLDPLIGFYHRLSFARESMACDLIEPLRTRVDAWVWQLFRTRELRAEGFTEDKGACLLNKSGRARFYAAWENQAHCLRRHLRRECAVVVRALRSRGQRHLIENDEAMDEID
jgi:CRISP-associated protein Cas1